MTRYAGFSHDSDVHVASLPEGGVECYSCLLMPEGEEMRSRVFYNRSKAITHFLTHRASNHKVPKKVFDSLEEAPENVFTKRT